MKRTIFIGDIHGCFDELQLLLKQIQWDSLQDRLYFCGDLINRGPKSFEVLKFCYENSILTVRGNHEDSFLSFIEKKQSIKNPKKLTDFELLYQQILRSKLALIDWLQSLPYYIQEDNFILVHAGLTPGKSVENSRVCDLLRIRTWDGSGKDTADLKNPSWYQFYAGSKPVIYGHFAQEGLNIRSNTIGLDSGCVWGGKLSAYILETGELFQIDALKAYLKY